MKFVNIGFWVDCGDGVDKGCAIGTAITDDGRELKVSAMTGYDAPWFNDKGAAWWDAGNYHWSYSDMTKEEIDASERFAVVLGKTQILSDKSIDCLEE